MSIRIYRWEHVVKFLSENEKARIIAEPYPGGTYDYWIVFVPLVIEKNI